jgi:hypothetical protein
MAVKEQPFHLSRCPNFRNRLIPYIGTLENGPAGNTILNDTTSFLMTLKKGTTMGEAQKLVEHLNQVVEQISIQP